jgi:hypothetical protein
MICQKIRIHKPRRLFHIYFFLKNVMQERILHIQLAKNSTMRHGKRKNQSYSRGFDHVTKGVIVVDAKVLLEPFRN